MDSLPEVRFGSDGLVPAVVQDAADGRVLMVAWMDAEALGATLATRLVHFHSRSRGRLWRKGETSGNVLHLRSLSLDCDADTLLVTATPAGPTCHRGTRSCFDADPETRTATPAWPGTDSPPSEPGGEDADTQPTEADAEVAEGFAWLGTLWATILSRAMNRPEGSYTTSLLEGGVDAIGRKVTEEATEVLIAAKDDAAADSSGLDRAATSANLADETADLLYHVLVLLAERGTRPSDVIDVLRTRHTG
jgi:phosphoribosyl-AMP cyclohydrolase / phosphoribosyl-ATP pyrophosphohydrolase